MNKSIFVVSEKIYESDRDLLYDLSKPIKHTLTWRNNIVLKRMENNTVCYHIIHEEENVMTLEISSLFYKSFHDRDEALKEALENAKNYNLR